MGNVIDFKKAFDRKQNQKESANVDEFLVGIDSLLESIGYWELPPHLADKVLTVFEEKIDASIFIDDENQFNALMFSIQYGRVVSSFIVEILEIIEKNRIITK